MVCWKLCVHGLGAHTLIFGGRPTAAAKLASRFAAPEEMATAAEDADECFTVGAESAGFERSAPFEIARRRSWTSPYSNP